MDALHEALNLAGTASALMGCPGLAMAVKVAVRLVKMAKVLFTDLISRRLAGLIRRMQEIKDTRDGMRLLAEHAAAITQAIYNALRSFDGLVEFNSRSNDHLEGLLR